MPFALFSAYLFFTRWPSRLESGTTDWIALAASCVAAAAFVALLPVQRVLRTVLAILYLPLSAILLFFYGFYFVGMVFGDWL